MNSFKYYIPLFLIFLISCTPSSEKDYHVVLQGKVVDRDYSSSLRIVRATSDMRYEGDTIPISRTGDFTYKMANLDAIEEYRLIFSDELEKGTWSPIQFYPDNDTIHFVLYPEEQFSENSITGSELTDQLDSFLTLFRDTFIEQLEPLYDEFYALEEANADDETLKTVEQKITDLHKEMTLWQVSYFKNHPDLASYSQYLSLLRRVKNSDLSESIPHSLSELLAVFSEKYPNHPYTAIAHIRLSGIENTLRGSIGLM